MEQIFKLVFPTLKSPSLFQNVWQFFFGLHSVFFFLLSPENPKKTDSFQARQLLSSPCKQRVLTPTSVNLRPRRLPSNSQDICQGVRLLTPDSSTASPLPKWMFSLRGVAKMVVTYYPIIGSMYVLFPYIWLIFMVNVCRCS